MAAQNQAKAAPSSTAVATGELQEPFKTIWTRKPSEKRGQSSVDLDDLYVMRVGLNSSYLAVDLQHFPVDGSDPRKGAFAAPEIKMLVDGCPAELRAFRGQVVFGGPQSRIFIPRANLPRGDLDLTFKVFDTEYTMVFANDERGLRTITDQERKGYTVTPADPATGELGTVEVYESDKCVHDIIETR